MKISRFYLIAAISPALALSAFCQIPQPPAPAVNVSAPPPPVSGPRTQDGMATSHSSRVSAIIYGPQGEVQALTLRNGVAVTLPPEMGMRLQSNVSRGSRVRVSGIQRMIAGQPSLFAQSMSVNGQTFVAAAAPVDRGPGRANPDTGVAAAAPPPPPAGPPDPQSVAGRGPGAPPPPPRNAGNTPPPPPGQDADSPVPPPPGIPAPPAPPTGTPSTPQQM